MTALLMKYILMSAA